MKIRCGHDGTCEWSIEDNSRGATMSMLNLAYTRHFERAHRPPEAPLDAINARREAR